MSADNKYPNESDRRRFVKGVVGGASLAAVGATSAATMDSTTAPSGSGGGATEYMGIEVAKTPAPRPMPVIPLEIDSDGFLRGRWPEVEEVEEQGRTYKIARENIGGIEYSNEWFQYCGVQTYPGVRPDVDQDNYFRYTKSASYEWMNDINGGDRVHIDDFEDFKTWGNGIGESGLGKPASATWRSQGVPPSGTLPVEIIRVAPAQYEQMVSSSANPEFVKQSTDDYFMAHLNKCTHFCCVPGFKSAEYPEANAVDRVYCQCHQSVYDPFSIVRKQFVALPRPE